MKIIALSGKMRSGKDESALVIQELFPYYEITHFADCIKEMFAKEYNIPINEMYDPYQKQVYRVPLQEFGDFHKKDNKYFFTLKWYESLEPGKAYIVADMRFMQEVELITKLGGRCFKVWADNPIRLKRGWQPSPADDHESETELPSWSAYTYYKLGGGVIYNNTNSREDLRREILLNSGRLV